MVFRFKNKNYGKIGDISAGEIFGYEGEDQDTDPNMFVLKTKETSKKGGLDLVGTKRPASFSRQSFLQPRKI
jgi:hypothetical protein